MEAITGRNTGGLAIGPCRTFWLLPCVSNYDPLRFLAGNDDVRRCVRHRGRVYVTLGKASRRRGPDGRRSYALGAPNDLCSGVDDVSYSARALVRTSAAASIVCVCRGCSVADRLRHNDDHRHG